ncbi:Thermolabile hemolysin [Smittium mucronatum]|uniref:Thermolabile hemolysin n=1 Tax=Smittium mucronatum TaxID=133383 RepID=A0A1R0GYA5_9FUNG|nr:Thermolabile hemolysin [Smittium mucronatum]
MSVSSMNQGFLIVFGDSYSSVGNRENVPSFYADWFTRYSNGPVWDEYVAFNDDYTLINFATGGALTNNSYIGSQTGVYLPYNDLVDQVAIYEDAFSGKYLQSSLQNDVVVIQIGSNDIFSGYEKILDGSINQEIYFNNTISTINSQLESLMEFGYKNFVLFDVSYFPILPALTFYDQDIIDALDNYTKSLNDKLEVARASLEAQYSNKINYIRSVSLYDIFKTLNTVDLKQLLNITAVYNPKLPILTNVTYVTQNDSDDYLFSGIFNPTTRVHALIASIFSETIKTGSVSINKDVLEKLVCDYDLIQINSYNNPLYTSNSSKTGIINVKEYTVESTLQNVGRLAAIKNSQVYKCRNTTNSRSS